MPTEIIGSGSYFPEHVVASEELEETLLRWIPDEAKRLKRGWSQEKLGIRTRHLQSPLDAATGRPLGPADEIQMAAAAGRRAMERASLTPDGIDGLWYVTCTQRHGHFGSMVGRLHRALGLSAETSAREIDSGCGGTLQTIICDIMGRSGDRVDLVVASNAASQYMDAELYTKSNAWHAMVIFGDGASALALKTQRKQSSTGIIAEYAAVDPAKELMRFHAKNGASMPVYEILSREVFHSFRVYARDAIEKLQQKHWFELESVDRFYFHQVNVNVLRRFVEELEIPMEKVAVNVDRYGNIAAAATPALLDEDIENQRVKPGDLVLFCTVGAGAGGVEYNAALVRL